MVAKLAAAVEGLSVFCDLAIVRWLIDEEANSKKPDGTELAGFAESVTK